MELLPTILEMRKNLALQCERLSAQSSLKEQEAYFASLCHYKKIWIKFVERTNDELFKASDKAYKNIRSLQEGKPYEELITR